MWRRFVGVAFLSSAASAWTPQRPSPVQHQQRQKSRLSELPPWAAAGLVAVSIAFSPLPVQADTPPTGVRVDVETNSLIESIKENKGELNTAISKIVKDTPSEAIKLDPPESKADAIRDALHVGKEKEVAAVTEEPKMEAKVEEPQKEESKAEKLTEAPAAEMKKEEPKPAEVKAEAPTLFEQKAEAPIAEKEEEPVKAVAPTGTEEPKKEPFAEVPKPIIEQPKQETEPAAEKPPTIVDMIREKMNADTTSETPKPATTLAPKVEPLKEDTKKEEPAKVEAAGESPKEQAVMEAPKPVEEPKKEPVAEAPKATVEQPRKQVEPATEKKLPTIVDMLREKMNTDAPPVVTGERPEVPKQDIRPEAPSEAPAPETPKEATSPEGPTVSSTPVTADTPADRDVATIELSGFSKKVYDFLFNYKETKAEATKTNFDDVPFWERPAIRTIVPLPDGSGDMKLVFNNKEVATGSLVGVALSYLVTYQIYNYESAEEQRRAEEKKKEMAEKRAAAPKKEKPGYTVVKADQTTSEEPMPNTAKKEDERSTYTGSSYIDRLAATEKSPPQQEEAVYNEVSLKKIAKKRVEEPQAKPASTVSTAANGSYLDALSKPTPVSPNPTSPFFRPSNESTGTRRRSYAKTPNKPKPKAPRRGGSYLDSL